MSSSHPIEHLQNGLMNENCPQKFTQASDPVEIMYSDLIQKQQVNCKIDHGKDLMSIIEEDDLKNVESSDTVEVSYEAIETKEKQSCEEEYSEDDDKFPKVFVEDEVWFTAKLLDNAEDKPEDKKSINCSEQGCDVICDSPQNWLEHHNIVHLKRIKCIYENCNTFLEQTSLTAHIRAKHKKDRRQCPNCQEWTSIFGYHLHYLSCPSENKYWCSFEGCDMAFKTFDDRRIHINIHHMPIRQITDTFGSKKIRIINITKFKSPKQSTSKKYRRVDDKYKIPDKFEEEEVWFTAKLLDPQDKGVDQSAKLDSSKTPHCQVDMENSLASINDVGITDSRSQESTHQKLRVVSVEDVRQNSGLKDLRQKYPGKSINKQNVDDDYQRKIMCKNCNKRLTYRNMSRHFKQCFIDKNYPYQCIERDCNSTFATLNHWRHHEMSVHRPPIECPFKNCNKRVKLAALDFHLRRFHLNKIGSLSGENNQVEKLVCTHKKCGAIFDNKKMWDDHVKHFHDNPMICPYKNCNNLVKLDQMAQHIIEAHEKIRKQCEICKKWLSIYSIQAHKKYFHNIGEEEVESPMKFTEEQIFHKIDDQTDVYADSTSQLVRDKSNETLSKDREKTTPADTDEQILPEISGGPTSATVMKNSGNVKVVNLGIWRGGSIVCSAKGCDVISETPQSWFEHYNILHLKSFKCPYKYCNTFVTQRGLTRHIKFKHANI